MIINNSSTWQTLSEIITKISRIILWGIPATGKTSIGSRTAEGNFWSTTLTEEQDATELRGHYIPQGNKFVWQDGIGTRAWRRGGTLIINEAQNASADVLNFLYVLADDPHVAKLTLPTGETITPHPDFRIVMTTNNEPNTCLNDALMSRFPVQIKVETTDPWIISKLPQEYREVADETCNLPEERRVDVRKWFCFASLLQQGIDKDLAGMLVFDNHWETLRDEIALRESPNE